LTNGLGVSPDATRLYHSDTRAHAVWQYDREPDGSIGNRRALYTWDETGQPDGLAVAEDGSVWVAMAASGRVSVVTADGVLQSEIPVEVPMVTSVCFGGADWRDLYVVTGSNGVPAGAAGGVYKMRAPVAGLPLAKARVTGG
jgi:gluconolactonase